MMIMLVAAVQFEPRMGDKESNVARLLSLTEEAAGRGCRLVVWPEMATTGYCWYSREEILPLCETVPGPTTRAVAELARRHGVAVLAGLPEMAGRHVLYNAAVLITPSGGMHVYRKVHPFASEPKWAVNGAGFSVCDTELGRIGTAICMDLMFPETTMVLGALKAQILCAPVNWFGEKTPSPYWLTRCREAGMPGIFANRWGEERGVRFSGGSCVVDAEGNVLAQVPSGDGLAVADVRMDGNRLSSADGVGAPAGDGLAAGESERLAEVLLDSYRWDPLVFHRLYGQSPLPEGCRGTLLALAPGTDDAADLSDLAGRLEALLSAATVPTGGVVLQAGSPCLFVLPGLVVDDNSRALQRLSSVAEGKDAWIVGCLRERGPNLPLYYALGPDSTRWTAPASKPAFADLPVGRVGFLSVGALSLPVERRALTLRGIDVMCVPGDGRELLPPIPVLRVAAAENNVYLAATGRVVREGEGSSASSVPAAIVCGPDLHAFPHLLALARAGEGGGVAAGDLDTRRDCSRGVPGWTTTNKPLLRMRQTHAYQVLATAVSRDA